MGGQAALATSASAAPCDPPNNEIVCENSKAGNPPSEWDVSGAGDPNIQGFTTDISASQGETVRFKVNTPSSDYRLDIYRMGYYGGNGARKVATVQPSAALPQSQPGCLQQSSTGLVDCGNWKESASWAVPASAVSGIYFAKLVREDQSSQGSHVVFVVRDDDGESDLLFQTSDTTWQAYNQYGGNSLYVGGPGVSPGRAYAVSYNRPLTVRGTTSEDSPFNAEYPTVRWLERNGYDVSYTSGVDTDRRGAELLEHEAFLSVGHDEYWSGAQRANVEAARDAGVSLAFFSGNEVFWKTRWAQSIDGSGTSRRTLVCYKETHANKKLDPEPNVWTGTWRDPRFGPHDGGRPENQLTGTSFTANSGTAAIKVPAADGKMRLWRNTSVASLAPGATATLAAETLGYEWDEEPENGFRPAGLVHLSSTTASVSQRLLDYGSSYGPGSATHHLTLYRAPSGALVFGAGTIQWAWGLDGEHDRGGPAPDARMQQATVNLLADMGAQPGTLQVGLVAATQTTDSEPPVATISNPIAGTEVESGEAVTISGSASDDVGETPGGGEVGAVEVSVDGGDTWQSAEGREEWTFTWTPNVVGAATILARAIDDSGNIETSGDEVDVEVVEPSCPCSIWGDGLTGSQDGDTSSVEVGVKFRSDLAGYITGLRFYKPAGNGGTHVGHLWTKSGTHLAAVTFVGESPSGWQEASFEKPVAINSKTTYLASYHSPAGHYASLGGYFSLVGFDNPPLHALADGFDGPNGVYNYGPSGGLFSNGGPKTFNSENYLVDVVFEEVLGPDTNAPKVNSRSPVAGATDISADTSVTATFNEPMSATTTNGANFELHDSSGALVAASITYDSAQRKLTLDPNASLEPATTYTAMLDGGVGGVTDVAGNPLAADQSWSFTTVAPPPPPPNEGPGGPILVISNTMNPFSRYYSEILRAEGLNEYTAVDISNVTPALLASRDVAILGEGPLTAAQVTTLSDWVNAGGNLIAMRPDSDLASLLGLTAAGGTLANGYLQVDTGSSPGAGIVGETIQFHGTADRYTLSGAQAIATLYSSASTSISRPAVTLRSVGSNGGQAAAFTYDLARSIVYTRQGNPAWAGQERDGLSPRRSDDLFFGAKAGDTQPDWVDLGKVDIPQADEQQRLLTNLIGQMNLDRKPLPRFWFLPRDERAAVVMTGDDHSHGGTVGRFEGYEADAPPGCVVANWECVRATSYIYPNTPMTDSKAAQLAAKGFEIALHTWTNCEDWKDQAELKSIYSQQLAEFASEFPSLPAPTTNRTHCIVWSDWATQPKVELEKGIRLDTNYYYWPEAWVQDRPGLFTGSGMPMRFADLDGTTLDVYQATTQMTDESGQEYPFTSDELLDRALGPEGFYGVFTANMHTDDEVSADSDEIVSSALARGVPIVSARQMLTWLDGRNQSSFSSIAWSGDELSFTISPGPGANGLRAMVPTTSSAGPLVTVSRGGTPVTTTKQTIKGVQYAFFDAVAGSYTAAYSSGSPVISGVQVAASNNGSATVTWTTNEPANSRVDYGTSPGSLTSSVSNPALVTNHSIQLSGLEPGVTYHYRVTSADGEANSSTTPKSPAAPQSFATPPPAPTLSSTIPASPANQNSPKVVGSAAAGSTVSLYSTVACSGAPLATASAATLATGIEVPVADNSTTSFRATATSAAGSSTCSAPLAYVEDSSAPLTQIDSNPSALTNSSGANFTFSGSDPGGSGVTFQCRLDSTAPAAWAACTSPRSLSSLGEGTHTFEVRAVDAAGNPDATPASSTWTVDTKAPETQIDSQPPSFSSSTGANFAFSGTDPGGSGVASFQCRLDSTAPAAWAACTSPKALAGLGEGSHTFEARSIDQAGNADASLAAFTWTVDSAAPQTQIDSNPSVLSSSAAANFAFSGSDTGSGVSSFQCRLDSTSPGAWVACTSPRDLSGLADGPHTFEVRAIDQAGNIDQSPAGFSWSIDTASPNTTIDSSPPALTNIDDANFTFSGSDVGGSGVASFQCRLDSTAPGAWAACTSPKSFAGLAEGSHTFEVRAIDAVGNTDGTPASFTWTVDTAAPQTQIDSNPLALTNAASANFTFSGTDVGGSGVASFQCRLDSTAPAAWSVCTSPKAFAGLSNGSHTFEVRAVDTAGNADVTQATFTWVIDTAAPNTTIDASPPSLTNAAAAQLAFSGTDTGGSGVSSFQCRLDSTAPEAWSPCTSPGDLAGLSEGTHSFEVRALDSAGNIDPSPAVATWTVDTAAPSTTIDSTPPALTNSAAANFTFAGSDTGGSGVTSFQCRRDSTAPGAWEACTSPKAYAELGDGAHAFEVRAIDAAGNADQSSASFTWTVDTAAPPAPALSATVPASPANDNSPKVIGSAQAGSTVSLYAIDDCSGSPIATVTTAQLEAGVGVTVADDSTASFRATATDTAANTSACSAPLSYVEDSKAPETHIDAKPSALTNSAAASFTFSGSDSEGSGIASFQCRLDSTAPGAWAACASPKAFAGLGEGSHTFEVRAVDSAGNLDQSPASTTWTIDTVAPSTAIDSGPPALTSSPDASFAFSGTDTGGLGVASFQCRLDSSSPGAWAACTSPRSLSSLTEGSHTFEVRALDQAGNIDPSPAIFTWTVDTIAPQTQIDSNPPALVSSAAANFTFSGSDTGGSGVASFQCRLDSSAPGAWASCTSPKAFAGLSEGSHTFEVRTVDSAGNSDLTPASSTWVIDTKEPQTQVDSGPPAAAASTAAAFTFSGADSGGSGVASFQCRLDSTTPAAWAACTSPKAFAGLDDGSHTFEVRAVDQVGNIDQSPASFTWTVDTAAPQVVVDVSKALLKAGESSVVTWHADANGNFALRVGGTDCDSGTVLDSGAYGLQPAPHLSNVAAGALAEGQNTLRLCLTDAASNRGEITFSLVLDTAAPITQIDSSPPALTNSAAANFTFSGTDTGGSGVASFQCRLDSTAPGAWAACASPRSLSSLSEGSHTFEVRALDQAGNVDGTPATFTWNVDSVAPQSQIDSSPPALANTAAANFTFSGTDVGGSGVASFQCRLDSTAPAAWSACTSPKTLASISEGSHTFEVRTVDVAGNVDQTPAGFTWTVDTKGPQTQIDSNPPALSNSANANFTFSGSDTGGSGIASFECRRDSDGPGDWFPCSSPRKDSSLTEGSHSFEVRAIDTAGNVDPTPASFEWTIDTVAPSTQIDSGPNGLSQSAAASFGFSGSDSTGSGVASFECRLDSSAPGSWQPCGSPEHYAGLGEGDHTFEVRAIDQAGNVDPSPADFSWSIDTIVPDTAIDSAPPALSSNETAQFAFSGADGGSGVASFQCRLDSTAPSAWAACASPRNLAGLADGAHNFEVRAIDQAGNADQSPASFGWTIDTTAPAVSIDSGPAGLTNDSTPTFAFQSEPGAELECSIDAGAADFQPCSASGSHTPAEPLADGAYTFRVRAGDAAGNHATATRGFTVDTASPNPPELSATAPASPANDNTPQITGSAPAGTTVRLYTSGDCSGTPIATVTAATLEAGVEVTVADDSITAFRATATSGAANSSACSAPLTYVEDSSAPQTQVDSGPPALSSSSTASFAFSASDGAGSGVASFECRLDSAAPDTWQLCSSPEDYAGLADGPHAFEVRAIDQAGNVDPGPASFGWEIDTAAPSTTIDSSPPALSANAAAQFTFSGTDPGGSGAASFECRLDSAAPAAWTSCASPRDYAGLGDGAHNFEVRAVDRAGNTDATPATYAWEIDGSIPAAPELIATVPASPANDNTPQITGSAPAGTTVRLYTSSDCSGTPIATVTAAGLEGGVEVTVADDSITAFRATATSSAANSSACSAPLAYVEDSSAPHTQVDSGPPALSSSSAASFAFSASDGPGSGVAGFECRLDSTAPGAWVSCETPEDYAGLADGPHAFEVRAIDQAGNVDSSPALDEWVIDTTSPKQPQPEAKPPIGSKPTPSASLRFLRVKYNKKDGTAFLILEVSGPGELSARAPEIKLDTDKANATAAADDRLERLRQKRIKPKRIQATRAGLVKLKIRLAPAGERLLEENGKLKVTVIVDFKAADGSSMRRATSVTLRKLPEDEAQPSPLSRGDSNPQR